MQPVYKLLAGGQPIVRRHMSHDGTSPERTRRQRHPCGHSNNLRTPAPPRGQITRMAFADGNSGHQSTLASLPAWRFFARRRLFRRIGRTSLRPAKTLHDPWVIYPFNGNPGAAGTAESTPRRPVAGPARGLAAAAGGGT